MSVNTGSCLESKTLSPFMLHVCLCLLTATFQEVFPTQPGPYYPLGTTGTVPRAYEGMGEKMKKKK
jgi:hypothetical protein